MPLQRSSLNIWVTWVLIGLLALSTWFLRWRYIGTQWRVNRFTGTVQKHVFPKGGGPGKWVPAETPDIEFAPR